MELALLQKFKVLKRYKKKFSSWTQLPLSCREHRNLSDLLTLLKSSNISLLQEKGSSTDTRKRKDGKVIKVKEQ